MTPGTLVAVAYAHSDPDGTPVGTLTEATSLSVTVEMDGVGAGEVGINGNSSQAAWIQPGNYIAIWRNAVSGDPIAGFWVDDTTDTLISPDEEGGEEWRSSGSGPIMCLDEAIVWNRRFKGGNLARVRPRRGKWIFRRAGGFQIAAVLIRMVREAKARGCLSYVSLAFDQSVDSDGDAWPDDTEVTRYSVPIGITLTELVTMLRAKGLRIEMDASFRIHAWPDDRVNDLSGSITIAAGTEIREEVVREQRSRRKKSHVLVGGERKKGGERYASAYNSTYRAALGRRHEGFRDIGRVAKKRVLKRAGARSLGRWARLKDGATSVAVIDTTNKVAMVDYVPGDRIGLTIPGFYSGGQKVHAITLVMAENGEYDPVLEFNGLVRGEREDWSDDAATAVRG